MKVIKQITFVALFGAALAYAWVRNFDAMLWVVISLGWCSLYYGLKEGRHD